MLACHCDSVREDRGRECYSMASCWRAAGKEEGSKRPGEEDGPPQSKCIRSSRKGVGFPWLKHDPPPFPRKQAAFVSSRHAAHASYEAVAVKPGRARPTRRGKNWPAAKNLGQLMNMNSTTWRPGPDAERVLAWRTCNSVKHGLFSFFPQVVNGRASRASRKARPEERQC